MEGNNSSSFLNSTKAPTATCPQFESSSIKVATIVVYLTMSVIAIAGNSFLVRIIHKNPRMRTSFNYYIANMAISDILVQFFAIPRIVVEAMFRVRRWLLPGVFGTICCKLVIYVQEVCTTVSIECLVLIAIDRLMAVVQPATRRYTSRKSRLTVISLTWVIALLAASVWPVINYVHHHDDGHMYCVWDWRKAGLDEDFHNTYMSLSVFVYFVIPLSLITAMYSVIFVIVKRRRVPGSETCDRRQFKPHQKARANVLKLSFTVVVVFAISWFPHVVYVFLLMVNWHWTIPCQMHGFRFFVVFMAYSNTMTNPWVYFILSENYRQGLRKMFPWLRIRYKRNSLISSRGSRTRSRASKSWNTHQTDSGAEAEIGPITDQESTTRV